MTNQKLRNIEANTAKRRILKYCHKEFIEKLVDTQFKQKLTAFNIRMKLGEKFEELKNVSKSTITRWLKSDLNCSYKKMARKSQPALTNESLTKVLQVATIQQKLYSQEVEIIYVDEFSVNTRNHQFYGWSRRGHQGLMKIQAKYFSMTFICAVSNKKVYGILGNQSTNKSKDFKFYLRQLVYFRSVDTDLDGIPFILMYDNAKIYTSNEVWTFIHKSDLRSISIVPYSPMLNPCEKLIACTKSNMRKLQSEGR